MSQQDPAFLVVSVPSASIAGDYGCRFSPIAGPETDSQFRPAIREVAALPACREFWLT